MLILKLAYVSKEALGLNVLYTILPISTKHRVPYHMLDDGLNPLRQ